MKNDLSAEHLAQEVTLCLPLSAVLRLANDLPPPLVAGVSTRLDGPQLPVIGAEVNGEIFAGLTIDANGQPAALWLLPGEFEGPWQKAVEWADDQDGALPSRIDQLVLRKNVRGQFKDRAYWSSEQYADGSDWAWCQYFNYGDHHYDGKVSKLLARAVRRTPL